MEGRRKILLPLFFLSFFLLSASSAFACYNPTVYNQHGTPINPFGGMGITINGTTFSSFQVSFPISIENINTQGLTVILRPYGGLRNYIDDAVIYLQAGQKAPLNLNVWVGGLSYDGAIQVGYTCDDGTPQFWTPIVNVRIIGQNIEAPPNANCNSNGLSGCYSGMMRSYYCSNNQLQYTEQCTNSCCSSFGGTASACSDDKKICFTMNNMPPPTQGKIAFVCKDKCDDGSENSIIFLLRLQGWNVTGYSQAQLNKTVLDQCDIVACSDETKACKFSFNSMLYNEHTDSRKPFLEVPTTGSLSASSAFGYLSNSRTSSVVANTTVKTQGYLTPGLSGFVQLVKNAKKYLGINEKYLDQSATDVLNISDSRKTNYSVMFTEKESPDHGRYAYWGLFSDSMSLTPDGKTVFDNTLQWLKAGDAAFGGTNDEPPIKGKIAFVCSADNCARDNEEQLMKFLRSDGYSVTGKSKSSWTLADLGQFDLIVCSDSSVCTFTSGSPLYLAHSVAGKPLLEAPYNGGIKAAYTFGYVDNRAASSSGTGIIAAGASTIFNGFKGYVQTEGAKSSIYGMGITYLRSSTNLATVTGTNTSAMFVHNPSGTSGRYAYIGWIKDAGILSDIGQRLLARTVDWLVCGDGCIPPFQPAFPDVSLSYVINTPQNSTYKYTAVNLNLTANQYVKSITASVNGTRATNMCSDCSSANRRLTVKVGTNRVDVNVTDYNGVVSKNTILFSTTR